MIIIIKYKGEPLTLRYYNEHREIHIMYPTSEVFTQKLYVPLFEKEEATNEKQVLEISENLILINEIAFQP